MMAVEMGRSHVIQPIALALLKVLRLGLGYFGNLEERVPWLLGFWMLTLFPQPILLLYFLVIQVTIDSFLLPYP